MANQRRKLYPAGMGERRKHVIGLRAAILASLHMRTADDLFGGPQGKPTNGQASRESRKE